jgi:hypothetical protein
MEGMATRPAAAAVGEAVVVHTWLSSEFQSDDARDYVKAGLDQYGHNPELITSAPDFADAQANAQRWQVLKFACGGILHDLPPRSVWLTTDLSPSDVRGLRYLGAAGCKCCGNSLAPDSTSAVPRTACKWGNSRAAITTSTNS